jgi:UDP-N-acetylmuramate dehydrogenase
MTARPAELQPEPPGPERLREAEAILRAAGPRGFRTDFVLAPLTSFRLGGPAALYLEAEVDGDLGAASEAVAATDVPWMVIGKGSNLLISDTGYPGLVIRLGRGYRWVAHDGTRLEAGAAKPLPALAGDALAHGLAGLEFGVAIPGSVGGAVRMNAGAHEGSMDQILERIDLFEIGPGARSAIPAAEAGLGYRRSALPRGSIVVAAAVALSPGDPAEIRRRMDAARALRRATQPLAEPNCGSVFTNPPGDHAARLVEVAGCKGMEVGGAQVSTKHANFIVARPGTTAADVRRLIDLVQDRVRERLGVALEPEVRFVGDLGDRPAVAR